MDKIWLKCYDKGVPEEINLAGYTSLSDYLNKNFQDFAQFPAYENMGFTLTFAEMEQRSKDFAAYLQNTLELQKGDRFAIMLPNLLQYVIAMFAAVRVGLIVVNVNPLYTTRELAHQLKDSGAKAILVLENFANVVQMALPKIDVKYVITTQIGDAYPRIKAALVNFVVKYVRKMVPKWSIPNAVDYRKVMKQGAALNFTPVPTDLDDIAYLQYTGGTTGGAKGAGLTNRNMLSNIMQLHSWVSPFLVPGQKEIVLTSLPLYHIFSLTVNCWTFLHEGAKNVLITNPRDIPGFIKEISKSNFTTTTGVNTLFNALLNSPDFPKLDFSKARFILSGGMALQRSVSERWKKLTGLNIVEGYGLTEASPVVSVPPMTTENFTGSIGIPLPSTECAVMDDDGVMAQGEEGELCVRGPQVMKGYWNRPDATDKVISKEGWLYTGDIARMDENGYFFIVDRKKNMIVVSGFNVYPSEIEEVVSGMSEITEAAAVGIPDEKTGERIKLFVVRKDPELTKEQIKTYCYTKLTRYKVPKDVEFRDELPKSNVGKILHRVLRDEELNKA